MLHMTESSKEQHVKGFKSMFILFVLNFISTYVKLVAALPGLGTYCFRWENGPDYWRHDEGNAQLA